LLKHTYIFLEYIPFAKWMQYQHSFLSFFFSFYFFILFSILSFSFFSSFFYLPFILLELSRTNSKPKPKSH
jgi:hypothetical protein